MLLLLFSHPATTIPPEFTGKRRVGLQLVPTTHIKIKARPQYKGRGKIRR